MIDCGNRLGHLCQDCSGSLQCLSYCQESNPIAVWLPQTGQHSSAVNRTASPQTLSGLTVFCCIEPFSFNILSFHYIH